ncbi:hypothetical protein BX666DRAFT_1855655 [Dichotomocladium elegans]|nr:hypothetical protein BX666DRAFT_1855655 [Dichotomocladium elegans]
MTSKADHDADTAAFFKEIEDDAKHEYAKCSVSQTFDAVWQCYTLGAQALNYYRYGEKKDCSAKWEDFKFCLTTKTKSNEVADVRKEGIRKQEYVWDTDRTGMWYFFSG